MRPGPGLLRLLLPWAAIAVLAALWPPLLALWALVGLAVAAAAYWSATRLRGLPPLLAERNAPGSLALGVSTAVRLRLTNPGAEPVVLEVFDTPPAEAETVGLPVQLTLPAGGWAEIEYRLRPLRRGGGSFGQTELLLRGPGDLWRRRALAGEPQPVRVLPNFQAVSRYALIALEDQLGPMGVRRSPRRGEGMEFQELREYRAGDSLRRIDWKATARRQQLISRQYQDERNQQVICLMDCGRRLRSRDGELSHFDHVLNAVLLLAYVALRQGDSVGLLTFSGERRYLPPVKGPAGLPAVLRTVYDLETTIEPSDFLEAATELMQRQRRRALVVLLTNLRDEDSEEILPALRLLRTRHLVLLASLREKALGEVLAREPRDLREALRIGGIHRYLAARQSVLDKLQAGGILTVDIEPDQLASKVVNRYLDVKRSGML
jgi:uncharacterized protein (DUF58 family)